MGIDSRLGILILPQQSGIASLDGAGTSARNSRDNSNYSKLKTCISRQDCSRSSIEEKGDHIVTEL